MIYLLKQDNLIPGIQTSVFLMFFFLFVFIWWIINEFEMLVMQCTSVYLTYGSNQRPRFGPGTSQYPTVSGDKLIVFVLIRQGEKDRNIIDVHDFSLVIPTLEYHNRTWTWHDLLMAMKKDCINVLVSQVRNTMLVSSRGELHKTDSSQCPTLKNAVMYPVFILSE